MVDDTPSPTASSTASSSASRHPVLRVGCPMWAHPSWVGRFLSAGYRGRELDEYARWCNAVEGSTTFYAVPAPATVARWARQAPPEFRFAFKVPRHVTHELRLRGSAARRAFEEFLAAVEPLADRLGPVQLQMPPSFGPDEFPALRARARDRLAALVDLVPLPTPLPVAPASEIVGQDSLF